MSARHSEDAHASQTLLRRMTIAGAVGVAAGLVGFLTGITERVTPQRPRGRLAPRVELERDFAPSYSQLATRLVEPGHAGASDFSSLQTSRPGLFDVVVRSPEMKAEALSDRLRTRAFDGAPPVVPHPVDQQSATTCLVCHGEGARLGDRLATRMSHARFTNCTQCHVEAAGSLPPSDEIAGTGGGKPWSAASTNEFRGQLRAGPGVRAMPHAPPAIPHTMQLREDCLSCHGLVTRSGLRTMHPWLQNCVQCHVPSATLDFPGGDLNDGR